MKTISFSRMSPVLTMPPNCPLIFYYSEISDAMSVISVFKGTHILFIITRSIYTWHKKVL